MTSSEVSNSPKKHLNNGNAPRTNVCSAKDSLPGHKSYVFWTLVCILCLLALANTLLTVVIFRVLHLGHGLESMELIPGQGVVKFFGETYFGKLFKPDGKIKGFSNSQFEVKAVKAPIIFEVEDSKGRVKNSLNIDQNGFHIKGVKDFTVGEIFSIDFPNFKFTNNARNIETQLLSTSRVSSPVNEKLVFKSDYSSIKMSGSEGTFIEGKEILWTADQEIHLKTVNGSIVLSGKEGISINVKSIPVVVNPVQFPLSTQYKVCVCMPEGRLFRVPISRDASSSIACHNVDIFSVNNPCM